MFLWEIWVLSGFSVLSGAFRFFYAPISQYLQYIAIRMRHIARYCNTLFLPYCNSPTCFDIPGLVQLIVLRNKILCYFVSGQYLAYRSLILTNNKISLNLALACQYILTNNEIPGKATGVNSLTCSSVTIPKTLYNSKPIFPNNLNCIFFFM
jgi:hypothetical protein